MRDDTGLETNKADAENVAGRELRLGLLGELCWICSHSPTHRQWPMSGIQRWLIPAIVHRQVRVYRKRGKPHAFVSWAYMSKDVEEDYVLNTSSLKPADWRSGTRIWLIDWVAPFGGTHQIGHDLKHNIFPDDVGRFLRYREGDPTLRIRYIHGVRARHKFEDPEVDPAVDLQSAKARQKSKTNMRRNHSSNREGSPAP